MPGCWPPKKSTRPTWDYDASSPDTGVSWPFVWYLRDYTNTRPFDTPSKTLRESPFIIVDQKNFDKIGPVVGEAYYRFDYTRMWWPNQEYFGLTYSRAPERPFDDTYPCTGIMSIFKLWKSTDFSRLCRAVTDRDIRTGIFDIWLDRDFTRYAEALGSSTMTLTTWEPSDKMRLYIRKDIAEQIWDFGITPAAEVIADPYEKGWMPLAADLVFGTSGSTAGQFQSPRGLALAPDGSIYVADSRNHRIQHFAGDGKFLSSFGTYANYLDVATPIGTFNEPWGVAVSPDGRWVYVTDTWNHRVEKFTAAGAPVTAWGYPLWGQTADPFGLWGPRGIAVDSWGHVFVVDTGNKRIVIFDANGKFLSQFGDAGVLLGQFDEPVDVAIDANGYAYVTDTWNQRVQVFAPGSDGQTYTAVREWEISGWYGQSLDNKPFVSVDAEGHILVTDPEGYRVLEFTNTGEFIRTWGDYGAEAANFGVASGITADDQGHVWVSDAGNSRIVRFTLPAEAVAPQSPASVEPSASPNPDEVSATPQE